MNKEEVLNAFLLANIPEIITQEEFDDVKKSIRELQQENQELKKQLEDSKNTYLLRLDSVITTYKNQQKEFIDYLENEIDRLEKTEFYIDSIQKAAIETHKHNLSKYREIIGGKE